MRGGDGQQAGMFSYVSPERRIPADHPLRPIREMTDEVLRQLSRRFAGLYAKTGRPSIAPEKLLRALLLQVLYSVRSERLLMEQLQYNLLFRWFVGLSMDDPVWDVTVFTKNRERLLRGDVADAFFQRVLELARGERLLSDEHFSVDGTLIQAWAGQKSFVRKGTTPPPPDDPGNPTVNFHGEKRSNATHASITDSDALLFKKAKGHEAKLCYLGHVPIENRHGLVVNSRLTRATGRAEWEAAWVMAKQIPGRRRATFGADKHYDDRDFVACLRTLNVTPHVAQKQLTALDARTTRHAGYGVSQRVRKARRGSVRVVEDRGALPSDAVPGARARRLDVHLRGGRLQFGATADAPGGGRMRRGGGPWSPSAASRRPSPRAAPSG
jgi:transposase